MTQANSMPRLSIITINYNNFQGLQMTLDSVGRQTCKEFEHIIIDGGSTDGSKDLIEEYAKCASYNVNWVSEKDSGIYNAMNKGINRAKGEYVQILNSGDCLASCDVIEKMLHELNYVNEHTPNAKKIPILYGNMLKMYPTGKSYVDRCLGYRAKRTFLDGTMIKHVEWTMYDFIKGTINHDPTYIRKDLFDKYGFYDEELKICSDWKWFVNVVVFGSESVFYIPITVTIFDMTGISETNITYREQERHEELKKMLPKAILSDYDTWYFPIAQMRRLKKYRFAYGLFWFIERTLFKLEKISFFKNDI